MTFSFTANKACFFVKSLTAQKLIQQIQRNPTKNVFINGLSVPLNVEQTRVFLFLNSIIKPKKT